MGQQVFITSEDKLKKVFESKIKEVYNKIPEAQRSNDEQIERVISGGSNSYLLQKFGMICH